MRLIPYTLPLAQPYRWSKGTQTTRSGVLVNVQGGWGEIAPPPHVECPNLVEEARNPLFDNRVRCGHTTAQADALARGLELSVATYLHEERDAPRPHARVQVNALLTSDADILQEARDAWSQGIRTFKIKVGTGNDEARVEAIRDAYPDAAIRLDPNHGWKNPAAEMERFASYNIQYVEDPGPVSNPLIPIAIDEAATDVASVSQAIASGADAIILKPQRLGGPLQTLDALLLCKDEGVPVTITNSLETSVGVHACLQLAALAPKTAHGLATSRFFAKDVAPAPTIREGCMDVPKLGIGVEPCL
ncbi:MAG: mandelate racemase/muconate lactonizing enzyme family protein [Thermoplasmatota archaeon]